MKLISKAGVFLGVILIVIAILMFVNLIVLTLRDHQVEPLKLPTNSTPDIAQCDKELWSRIKDGCP